MRLIDADALTVALKRKMPISGSMRIMLAECLEEVRHAQTIESVQRVGFWVFYSHLKTAEYRFQCSECHANHRAKYDYCPSCGAKMGWLQ